MSASRKGAGDLAGQEEEAELAAAPWWLEAGQGVPWRPGGGDGGGWPPDLALLRSYWTGGQAFHPGHGRGGSAGP